MIIVRMILMMNKTLLWTPLGEWKPEAGGTKEHFRNLSAHKQGFELQNLDLFKDKYKQGFELQNLDLFKDKYK